MNYCCILWDDWHSIDQVVLQDINMTDRIAEAGKLMGIEVLDHVIIGADEFYSLADHGHIL